MRDIVKGDALAEVIFCQISIKTWHGLKGLAVMTLTILGENLGGSASLCSLFRVTRDAERRGRSLSVHRSYAITKSHHRAQSSAHE